MAMGMDLERIIEELNSTELREEKELLEYSHEGLDQIFYELSVSEDERKYDVFKNIMAAYEPEDSITRRLIDRAHSMEKGPELLRNILYDIRIGEEYDTITIGDTELDLPNQRCTGPLKYMISFYLHEHGEMDEEEFSDFCNLEEEREMLGGKIDDDAADLLQAMQGRLSESEEYYLKLNGAKSFYRGYLLGLMESGTDLDTFPDPEIRETMGRLFSFALTYQRTIFYEVLEEMEFMDLRKQTYLSKEHSDEMLDAFINNPLKATKDYGRRITQPSIEDSELAMKILKYVNSMEE